MQLRLKPRTQRGFATKGFVVKTVLIALIFLIAIFLLDKINLPAPSKLIKQEISNDKLITLK